MTGHGEMVRFGPRRTWQIQIKAKTNTRDHYNDSLTIKCRVDIYCVQIKSNR